MDDFFNDIAAFFVDLTDEEVIVLGIFGLLIFALGVIIGWIIQSRTTRRYKKELMVLRGERDLLSQRADELSRENKQFARELETVSREKVEAFDRVQTLQAQAASRDAELNQLRNEAARANALPEGYAEKIEELSQQNATLRQRHQLLEQEIEMLQDRLKKTNTAYPNTGEDRGGAAGATAHDGAGLGRVEGQRHGASGDASLTPVLSIFEQRFQRLEDHLLALTQENALLRGGHVADPRPVQPIFDDEEEPTEEIADEVIPPPVATDAGGEPLVIRADTTEPGVRKGSKGETEVVVTTTPSLQTPLVEKFDGTVTDDLKRIQNIGPHLESQLNQVDIFRYEQIAGWSAADVLTYAELIGHLPSLIENEDWVGQAKQLMAAETEDSAATDEENSPSDDGDPNADPFGKRHIIDFDAGGFDGASPKTAETQVALPGAVAADTSIDADDLKVVEGIGPKIESILKEQGINTLSQLADTELGRLREILDGAGSQFRAHQPKTWPVQAGLAADGKLDELHAWQRELKGGQ